MKMSVWGLAELAGHEGIVTTRYLDSVGVWTIGVGHTAAAGAPDPKTFTGELTPEQTMTLFANDVQDYELDVMSVVKVPITQYEFDALVSFHYNTGGIYRAALVRYLNSGDRERAAAAFMGWVTPREVTSRRMKEQTLFRTGKYCNGGKAGVYPATTAGRVRWDQGKVVDVLSLMGTSTVVPPVPEVDRRTIRFGSKGPDVAYWQEAINVGSDGNFGPVTEKATKAWQVARNLVPDGVVGPKTWAALEKEICQ